MQFTVQEALSLKPLEGVRVIAGHNGLQKNVEHVTVLDAPDAINWLRGGELVVTTAYMVKDDPKAQIAFVRNLVERGASGLGIKLRRFIEALPDEVLALADSAGLPIIEIPYEVAWIDIINPVMVEVLERQASVLQRSLEIHTQYINTVLRGGVLTDIATVLTGQINAPVVIADMDWKVMAAAGWPAGASEQALALVERGRQPLKAERVEMGGTVFGNISRVTVGGEGSAVETILISTVRIDEVRYGRILVLENKARPFGRVDIIALEHATTATALDILKDHAAKEVERRFRFNFWSDLMHAKFATLDALIERARSFGWDFTRPHQLLLIGPDGVSRTKAPEGKGTAGDSVRDRILKLLDSGASGQPVICFEYRHGVIALIPVKGRDPRDIRKETLKVAEMLRSFIGGAIAPMTVSVGVSRFYPNMLELGKAYKEAKECLSLGRSIFGDSQVVHFDDLGVYRVLSKSVGMDELRQLMELQLGDIERYDSAHGTDFLDTLERYFECGGNSRTAADTLYIHSNTLKYRLKRIEELIGGSLDDPEMRFNLEFAFRIKRFLAVQD